MIYKLYRFSQTAPDVRDENGNVVLDFGDLLFHCEQHIIDALNTVCNHARYCGLTYKYGVGAHEYEITSDDYQLLKAAFDRQRSAEEELLAQLPQTVPVVCWECGRTVRHTTIDRKSIETMAKYYGYSFSEAKRALSAVHVDCGQC